MVRGYFFLDKRAPLSPPPWHPPPPGAQCFFLIILDTTADLCGRFYWPYIKANKSGPLIRGKTHARKEVPKWMQHV